MTTTPILRITDGETTVNLLNKNSGIFLSEWTPALPESKQGGIFQSSPWVDGRRLVSRQLDNVIETFDLKIAGHNQDSSIASLRRLKILLEKAVSYWTTTWQSEPVWIEAKGPQETNPRYTLIHDYRIVSEDNPFAQPFFSSSCRSTQDDITLIVERGHWLSNRPHSNEALAISAEQEYDSKTFGTEETAAESTVVIGNSHATHNLTHVLRYDASAGTYTDITDSPLTAPVNLLPDPMAAGDICYFGSEVNGIPNTPFHNIVFYISRAAAGTYSLAWEYYDSEPIAGWKPIGGMMASFEFGVGTEGINRYPWGTKIYHARTTINGIDAYWIRVRVVSVTGNPDPPFQSTRRVYTANFNYIETSDSAVQGDLPALATVKYERRPVAALEGEELLTIAARSVHRGQIFTPFLNCTNFPEQNPSGIVCATGVGTTFVDTNYSHAGRVVSWSPGSSASMATRLRFNFNSTALAQAYAGQYRAKLIYVNISAVGEDITVRLAWYSDTSLIVPLTDDKVLKRSAATACSIADLGVINWPPLVDYDHEDEFRYNLLLRASASGGNTIYFVAIVLMPIDEYICEVSAPLVGASRESTLVEAAYYIDSTEWMKANLRTVSLNEDGYYVRQLNRSSVGSYVFQANTGQRHWFLLTGMSTTDNDARYIPQHAQIVTVKINERYLGMRGSS